MSFIDDNLLVGYSELEVTKGVIDTVKTFDNLGFTVHDEKSQFEPPQEITSLGFVINSQEMIVRLADGSIQKLPSACSDLLKQGRAKIRTVASCVDLMVSRFIGVLHGQLHYRTLERSKNAALRKCAGN